MSETHRPPPSASANQNPDKGKMDPTESAKEVVEEQSGDWGASIENATLASIPYTQPSQPAIASAKPPKTTTKKRRTPAAIQAQPASTLIPIQPSRTRNLSMSHTVPAIPLPLYTHAYGDQFGTYRKPTTAAGTSPEAAARSPTEVARSTAAASPTSPVVSRGYGDQFGKRKGRSSTAAVGSPSVQVEGRVRMSRSPVVSPILPVRGPAAEIVGPTVMRGPVLPVRGQLGSPPAAAVSPSSQVPRGNGGQFGAPGSPTAIRSPVLPVSRGNEGQFEVSGSLPAAIRSPILPVRGQFGTNATPAEIPISSPLVYENPAAIPSPSPHVSEGYYAGNQYGMYSEPPVAKSRGYEYASGNGNGNGQGFTENGWSNQTYQADPHIMPAPSLYAPNYGVPAWNPSTPVGQEIVPFGTPERRAVTEQSGYSPESAQLSMPRTPGRELPGPRHRNHTPAVGNFNLGHRYTQQKGPEPSTFPKQNSVVGVSGGVPSLAAARSKAVADLLNEDFVIRLPKMSRPTKRYEPEPDLSDEDFVVRKTPKKSKKSKKAQVSAVTRTEPVADLSDEDFVVPHPRRIIDPNIDPSLDPALATARVEFQNSTSVERARGREKSVEETPIRHSKTPSTTENGTVRQFDDSITGAARIREQLAGSPPSRQRTGGEISYNSSDEETLIDSEVEGANRDGDISDVESEYGTFDEDMQKWNCDLAKLRGVGGSRATEKEFNKGAASPEEPDVEETDDEEPDSDENEPVVEKPKKKYFKGPRKAAEPTGAIRMRLVQATELILSNTKESLEEAMEVLDEIILINAETHEAWKKKAHILLEWGQVDNAIKSLLFAAYLRPKHLSEWFHCADYINDNAGELRHSYFYILHICYSQALRANINSPRAQFGKADLLYEEKKYRVAMKRYGNILEKYHRHNMEALRKLAECAIEIGKIDVAKKHFADEIAWYRSGPEEVEFEFGWSDAIMYAELFSYCGEHAQALKELKSVSRWLLFRAGETYWDDVTEHDAEWDDDDLRRIEVDDYVPGKSEQELYGLGLPLMVRIHLGLYRLRLGDRDEALYHFDFLDLSEESKENGDEENLFCCRKVADLFLENEEYENALQYYEYLLSIPEEHPEDKKPVDLYMDMGKCYLSLARYEEARKSFQAAADLDSNDEISRQYLATIFTETGEAEKAFDMTSQAKAIMTRKAPQRTRRVNKKKTEPAKKRKERRVRLPKILPMLLPKPGADGEIPVFDEVDNGDNEYVDEPVDGPVTVDAAVDIVLTEEQMKKKKRQQYYKDYRQNRRTHRGRPREVFDSAFASAFADSVRLGVQASILEKETDAMRAGDLDSTKAWMNAAQALTDEFRAMKAFYPLDKAMRFSGYNSTNERIRGQIPLQSELLEIHKSERRLAQKLKIDVKHRANVIPSNLPSDFKGKSFSQWLDIFMEFAMLLARDGKQRDAYDICTAMKDCVIWYHSTTDIFLVHLCWSVCALILGDEDTVVNLSRWFMKEFQFTTDAYRMFSIFSRLVQSPVIFFNEAASQKFLLRQIRAMDYNLVSEKEKKKRHWDNRAYFHSKDADGNVIRNKELDLSLLMTFGYVLSTSGSQVIALGYFMRAYAVDPDNAMINLAIGLAYIHHNLKRQTENRQHGILQGLTFIMRYYERRKESEYVEERLEAHYNVGRTYHLLGLTHLALPYYWKVLNEDGEERKQREEGGVDGEGDVEMEEGGRKKKAIVEEELFREVAYAIKTIYEAAGNLELARAVVREFLVI